MNYITYVYGGIMEEKTLKIDIGRCIKAMLKRWYLIIAVGLVCGMVMYALKYDTPQYYSATASVYSSASGSYTETAQVIYAMQLYSEIIDSYKLAERAASIVNDSKVSASTVRAMTTASYKEDSPVIFITAQSADPTIVVPVANALAQSLVIEVQSMTGSQAIQVLDQAMIISTTGRGVATKVIIAFIAGAVLTAAVLAFIEIISDRVYRIEDAELDGKLEVIGIIPDQRIN